MVRFRCFNSVLRFGRVRHVKKRPENAAICSILQYLHCVPTLQQHTMERPPEDKMRYARFEAAFAAFVLLVWSGGGVGGG